MNETGAIEKLINDYESLTSALCLSEDIDTESCEKFINGARAELSALKDRVKELEDILIGQKAAQKPMDNPQ